MIAAVVAVLGFCAGSLLAQSYAKVRPITLTEQSGNTQTDVQVLLILDTQTLIAAGDLNPDVSDLLFSYDCIGSDTIPHYVGNYKNTDSTRIYLQFDSIPANGVIDFFMLYDGTNTSDLSDINIFAGPYSSHDSVVPTSTNNVVSNSSRGFIFSPTTELLVKYFGKYEPTGTTRYVTLWDVNTQSIIHQDTIQGASAATWYYESLDTTLWLQAGTSYILTLFQGQGDGYYFGTSTQAGEHITYGGSMRYCNNCTENTFPTSTLNNYHYGMADFWYYLRNQPTVDPIIVQDTASGGSAFTAILNADTSICQGDTVALGFTSLSSVNGIASFLWSPGTSLSDTTSSSPSAFPSSTTTYNVTVTDSIGCLATSSQTVNVTQISVDLGADSTVCEGDLVTFDAGAGFNSYSWTGGASSQTNSYIAGGSDTIQVTVTDSSGCTATDEVILASVDLGLALGADTTICEGSSLTLDAGAGYDSYAWTGGASSQTATFTTAGTISVTVSDNASGCSQTDDLVLNVSNPMVNLGADTTICQGDQIVLNAQMVPGASYAWSNGDTAPMTVVTMPGDYSVVVTDPFGCTATDTISIAPCVGIDNGLLSGASLSVHPNPFQGMAQINIYLENATEANLVLVNMNGQIVRELGNGYWEQGEHRINLGSDELASGIYYLRFQSTEGRLNAKVIITE